METESRPSDHIDPQAQLQELKRLEDAVAVEAWMPETPLWHAPLLGLSMSGFIYWMEGSGVGRAIGLTLAFALAVFGSWDTLRRRSAKGKRLGKPARIVAFYLVIFVASWLTIAGFTAAVAATTDRWPDQLGPLLAALFGGFLVSSSIIAVGIEVTNRWRNRWIHG